jgi:hypothetical protein
MTINDIFIRFDPEASKHRTILGQSYTNCPSYVSREFFDFLREIAARQVASAYRDSMSWLDTLQECLTIYESELGNTKLDYSPLERFETFSQEVKTAEDMVEFLKNLVETEFLDYVDMGEVDTTDIEYEHNLVLRKRHIWEKTGRKEHDPLEGSKDNDIGLSSYDTTNPYRAVHYPAMYSRMHDGEKIWLPNVRVLLKPQKHWANKKRPEPFTWDADDPNKPWLDFSPRETPGKPFKVYGEDSVRLEPLPEDSKRVILSFSKTSHVFAEFADGESHLVGTSAHADDYKKQLEAEGYKVYWKGKETQELEDTRVSRRIKPWKIINWTRMGGLPVFPGNGFNLGSAQLGAPQGLEYERRKNYEGPCFYSFGGLVAETIQAAFLSRLGRGEVELCRYRDLRGKDSRDWAKQQAWSIMNGTLKDGKKVKMIVFCDLRRKKQ